MFQSNDWILGLMYLLSGLQNSYYTIWDLGVFNLERGVLPLLWLLFVFSFLGAWALVVAGNFHHRYPQ